MNSNMQIRRRRFQFEILLRSLWPFGISLIALIVFRSPLWSYAVLGIGIGLAIIAIVTRNVARTTSFSGGAGGAPQRRGYIQPVELPPQDFFIGREAELNRIKDYLKRPVPDGPHVIIIEGAPGIGKTALAIHVARSTAQDYTDGQLFTSLDRNLSSRDEFTRILISFVRALQKASDPVPADDPDRLLSTYIQLTAGQHLMIILDETTDLAQVGPLLTAGQSCAVIITSRKHLPAKDGWLQLKLEPLNLDEAVEVLSSMDDRMHQDRGGAESIARAAGLHPLALRLAGASLADGPYWSFDLALDRLSPGTSTSTDKIADLLDSLDVSYGLLTNREQEAVQTLALLDGVTVRPWMLQAMMDVDESTVEQLISGLVNAGLLERVSNDAAGIPEYRLHELVQKYAAHKLQQTMTGQDQQRRRADLADARRRRAHPTAFQAALTDVGRFLYAGELSMALTSAREAISLARDTQNARAEALALAGLAELQAELGFTYEAEQLARESINISPRHDRSSPPARAYRCLGKVNRRLRHLSEAEKVLNQAIHIADQDDDMLESAQSLRELAAVLAEGPEPQRATEVLDSAQSCAAQEFTAEQLVMPSIYWARGRALLRAAETDKSRREILLLEAEGYLEIGAKRAADSGLGLWGAWISYERGRVCLAAGDINNAEEHAREALHNFASMRHRYGSAYCQLLLGDVFNVRGALRESQQMLSDALETLQRCGDPWMEAEASSILAKLSARMGQRHHAEQLLRSASAIYAELNDRNSLERAQKQLLQTSRISWFLQRAKWRVSDRSSRR